MKKVTTTLLIFLTVQFFVYSQGNLRFGMKAGANFSTIIKTARHSELSRNSTTSSKMGLHGGLTFEFLFSERISIQVEALYSAKGGKLISSEQTSDGTETVEYLNYMSFPVLGKYYATPSLSIELGPEISILSSAKKENSGIEENILKQMSKHDFAVVGGLSYEFFNGLFIQGRYSLGTNKNSIAYYRHKNSVIQASIGYIF